MKGVVTYQQWEKKRTPILKWTKYLDGYFSQEDRHTANQPIERLVYITSHQMKTYQSHKGVLCHYIRMAGIKCQVMPSIDKDIEKLEYTE